MRVRWSLWLLLGLCLLHLAQPSANLRHPHPNSHPHRAHAAASHPVSIPVLSISLTADPHDYLLRLLRSIDVPVDALHLTYGSGNSSAVASLVATIQQGTHELLGRFPHTQVLLNETAGNPGSVAGFNAGLRHLLHTPASGNHERAPAWCLVVNADVAFPTGVLADIAKAVREELRANAVADQLRDRPRPRPFGLGFTSLCCGAEWSAVVFTRQLVQVVGLMDENFFPAYFEDADYALRVSLSGFRAAHLPRTPLLHGALDGSKDYLSGLFEQLYLSPKVAGAELQRRRQEHYRGVTAGKSYIERKWGVSVGRFREDGSYQAPTAAERKAAPQLSCKSVESINGEERGCSSRHKVPFGKQGAGLGFWELDWAARGAVLGPR